MSELESVAIFGQPYLPDLESFDYFMPIFNDGTLTPSEVFKEFQQHNLAVVLALRKCAELIVPLFSSPIIAKDFIKRNTKSKFQATSSLSEHFVNYCKINNVTFRFWDFPKKIDLNSGFEFDCLTLIHDEEVSIIAGA
jgi:hypothetical protein